MIAILVSAFTVLVALGGVAYILLWMKDKVGSRSGTQGRGRIEVLGRTGLHANQGLAVVKVGRRLLLVSSGDGGARLLTELSDADFEDPAATTEDAGIRAIPGVASWKAARTRRSGAVVLWLVAMLASTSGAAGQQLGSVGGASAPQGSRASGDPEIQALYERLPSMALQVGSDEEGLRLNGTVGTVLALGLLALAPSLILLTTSFTRILVVLHLLRQALGTQNTPPGHLLAALALLLSSVVMAPTLDQVRVSAVDPWLAGDIDEGEMMRSAAHPMRDFMLAHVREADLRTFLRISRAEAPETPDDISSTVLMSAFVTSELRAAFEIGFALFLPFVVIDLVVAAVLTSMGMFMLPPTMIALPCKLLLFVLMDGWSLLLGSLADSFV